MSREVTQVKFTIDSDTVSAFKTYCASEGVSMTATIRQWMEACSPVKGGREKARARRYRRKAVLEIIHALNRILELESEYRDNIPEQFEQRYETADHSCDQLMEAIACLEDAY